MADQYILSLHPFGGALFNSVIHYCQETGNPSTPESHKAIFEECVSQVAAKLSPDINDFMYSLMELPNWTTIHYLDAPVDYDRTEFFRNAVRAFAVCLWHEVNNRVGFNPNYVYLKESCTPALLILGAYADPPLIPTRSSP